MRPEVVHLQYESADNYANEETRGAEWYNNNLHIGELGQIMAIFGKKVLGPKKLDHIPGITPKLENADIIAALNGPMAHIYVSASDDVGIDRWKAMPDLNRILYYALLFRQVFQYDELTDANKTPSTIMKMVPPTLWKALDKILVRENGEYFIFNGFDAQGNALLANLDSLGSNYIDAVNRISNMNNQNRSGDIVLLFKFDTGGNVHDRYTSGASCKSWHGSLNQSDSYVPFIVSYPGGNKDEIETLLKSDSVFGDQLHAEGNWLLPDVVKDIIKKQY